MKLVCDWGHEPPDTVLHRHCPECRAPLSFRYDAPVRLGTGGGMWRFADRLPTGAGRKVTLGEGDTPLIRSRLALGCQAYWKVEARNPTGSQKDRALAVAIAAGLARGATRVIMASTGSAGMSCAAYAARAGMRCAILCPGDTPVERLAAMWMNGAQVLRVDGSFEELMEIIAIARSEFGYYETTTYRKANPYQAEGPKTIAYEIVEEFGNAPDAVLVPVGGGGTLAGIWRGFTELAGLGLVKSLPRMVGIQHIHFNALALALERDLHTDEEVGALKLDASFSVVTKNLKHALPPDAEDALRALRESGGQVVTVTDEEALAAQRELAQTDGLFAEPSSSVGLVALRRLVERGTLTPGSVAVAVVTGSGLREMDSVAQHHHPAIPRLAVGEALDRLRAGA
jgi:threonine synthase